MPPCIKDNAMWQDVSNWIGSMEVLVHVPLPSSKPMVSLSNKEHLAHHGGKVIVISQEGVEAVVGLPLEVTPFGENDV